MEQLCEGMQRVGLNDDGRQDEGGSYNKQAIAKLRKLFPLVSVSCITATFSHFDNRFVAAHAFLMDLKRDNVQSIQEDNEWMESVAKIFIKNPRRDGENAVTNRRLRAEIVIIEGDDENEPPTQDQDFEPAAKGQENNGQKEDAKETFECECCFDDVSPQRIARCSQSKHMFCFDCVCRFVEEQVFGLNKTELPCMTIGGCQGIFSDAELERALPENTRKGLDKHVYQVAVMKAGMVDCWSCPNEECNGVAVKPETFYEYIECPKCNNRYCQECNEEPHRGFTCAQAKKRKDDQNNTASRNTAAEAMTGAVLRNCPGCNVAFFKEEGCNKMQCPTCHTLSCYVCRQKVDGYNHFCLSKDCRCGRCHLWTNSVEEDRMAREAAGREHNAAQVGLGEEDEEQGLVQQPLAELHRLQQLVEQQRRLAEQQQRHLEEYRRRQQQEEHQRRLAEEQRRRQQQEERQRRLAEEQRRQQLLVEHQRRQQQEEHQRHQRRQQQEEHRRHLAEERHRQQRLAEQWQQWQEENQRRLEEYRRQQLLVEHQRQQQRNRQRQNVAEKRPFGV